MASDATALSVTDALETNTATHPTTTHVEQAPAQFEVLDSSGLRNSPLGRLPAELRNKIFEMAFTHSTEPYKPDTDSMSYFFSHLGTRRASAACGQTSSALNIMATCKQIRFETQNLLLALNDINVYRGELRYTMAQLGRIVPLLKRIPRGLGPELGRVVLPVNCSMFRLSREDTKMETEWNAGGLKHLFLTYPQVIRHFQLFLDLDVVYHT